MEKCSYVTSLAYHKLCDFENCLSNDLQVILFKNDKNKKLLKLTNHFLKRNNLFVISLFMIRLLCLSISGFKLIVNNYNVD